MAKVLVVDDNTSVLTSLTRLLEENGHEVIPAQDGLSTMSSVIKKSPDIILMDSVLPGMSGLDLCVAIRHMPGHQHIPIIMITASPRQTDYLMASRLGVKGYLRKPLDPQNVLDLVAKHARN